MEVESRPRSPTRSSVKEKASPIKSRSRSRSQSPRKLKSISPANSRNSKSKVVLNDAGHADPIRSTNNEGSSSSDSESPPSPEKPKPKSIVNREEKESSSDEEEEKKEEIKKVEEPQEEPMTQEPAEPETATPPPIKAEEPTPNGSLPDVADLQKDGHILDLHPGDMEIGNSSVRSNEDSVNESEDKNHSQNNTTKDQPEQQQQQEQQPLPQYQPRNISTRKLSLSGSRDGRNAKKDEDEAGGEGSRPPQRKRRWGSLTKTSKSTPSISTESLKDLIPDYKPQLSTLSILPEEPQSKESPNSITPASGITADASGEDVSQEPPEKVPSLDRVSDSVIKSEPTRVVQLERRTSNSSLPNDKTGSTGSILPHKGVLGVSVKEELESKTVVRAHSPAKNPASRILFIRNLVRPFTLPQLKEMLARTGAMVPDAFWIDKIKSKCYVMYESQDDAVNTRTALHGSRWPLSNPKTLLVDYSTEDELNFHKQLGESPGLPPPIEHPGIGSGSLGGQKGDLLRSEEQFPHSHRLAKNMTVVVSQNVPATSATRTTASNRPSREDGEKIRGGPLDGRQGRPQPVREWDRDKLSQELAHGHHGRSHHGHNREPPGKGVRGSDGPSVEQAQGPSIERERKERSSRKEKKEVSKKKAEEPPGKLLDDLFRKTKAVPCIYWLPLTESALAQREMEKKQWEAEREKRREKRQETGFPPDSGERKGRVPPPRDTLKPLPPPMLTGGNMAPLKGREFSSGRSRSPVGRRR